MEVTRDFAGMQTREDAGKVILAPDWSPANRGTSEQMIQTENEEW